MPRRGPPFKLAEVEDQLLVLIAAGASARTIAEIYGVDPNTVKNQLRRMRRRRPDDVRAALLACREAKDRNGVPGRRPVVDEPTRAFYVPPLCPEPCGMPFMGSPICDGCGRESWPLEVQP